MKFNTKELPPLELILQYFRDVEKCLGDESGGLLSDALTIAVTALPDSSSWLRQMWVRVSKSFGLFNHLNADCLSVAFGYLDFHDLMHANRACSKW